MKSVLSIAVLIFASSAFAADMIYLPAAIHLQNGNISYTSGIDISNLSEAPVSVMVLYAPVNEAFPKKREYAGFIHLAALERRTYADVFVDPLERASGNGMLVFIACIDGRNCGDVDRFVDPLCNISVDSTIYTSITYPVVGALRYGQRIRGIAWHDYVSSDSETGLDQVQVVGIREDAGHRTKIGIANADGHSVTTIVIRLYDGRGVKRGQRDFAVGPFANFSFSASDLFPVLTENRLDRAPVKNPYVVISQASTSLYPDRFCYQFTKGPPCPEPTAKFIAYGSVTDTRSGDSEYLPASFLRPPMWKTDGHVTATKMAIAPGSLVRAALVTPRPSAEQEQADLRRAIEACAWSPECARSSWMVGAVKGLRAPKNAKP